MVASLFVLTNDVELIAGSYGIASLITYMLTVIALPKFKALNGASGFTTPTVTLRGVKVPVLTIIGLPVLAVALALVFIFKPPVHCAGCGMVNRGCCTVLHAQVR
jgi:hypothetical protein